MTILLSSLAFPFPFYCRDRGDKMAMKEWLDKAEGYIWELQDKMDKVGVFVVYVNTCLMLLSLLTVLFAVSFPHR